MSTLGVIPAAGKGSRWGGYYKELLPCGDGEWLIDRAINTMALGGADSILVVSNTDKIATHAHHLDRHGIPIYYAIQGGANDIWSAIQESFAYPASSYLFAMPDTLFPVSAFYNHVALGEPFALGVFETRMPERFGILADGKVVNKSQRHTGTWAAWGLLSWQRIIVNLWQERKPRDYTDAINQAIEYCGLHTWTLDYYHDMATFADYQRWMGER